MTGGLGKVLERLLASRITSIVSRLEGPITRGLEEGGRRRMRATMASFAKCGRDVQIHPSVMIRSAECVSVGSNVHIGEDGHIQADGGLTIGDNTHISRRVTIYTSDHDFRRNDYLPYGPGRRKAAVSIGRNVWIGMNASILPGVKVGDGAIIAMGAIVTRDVAAMEIVAQPKAKRIGERNAVTYQALDEAGRYGGPGGSPYEPGVALGDMPRQPAPQDQKD